MGEDEAVGVDFTRHKFGFTAFNPQGFALRLPPPVAWHFTVGSGYVKFGVAEGGQPNAFHRLMQRLVLGIRWHRGGLTP